jgi:hypothetical protein
MSDKALIIEALQRLPEDATISDIRQAVEFIAAVKVGREQVRRAEVVSLNDVARKVQEWVTP